MIAVGAALLDTDFKSPDGKLRGRLVAGALPRIVEGIEQAEFDLMAFGRAFLANPDLADKLLHGDVGGLKSFARGDLERLV